MKKKHSILFALCLFMLLVLTGSIMKPAAVQAASFKNSKPKFTTTSAYKYNVVYLKWSKIKNAKKYEIYRSIMNPSTGKYGKWKKWTTTTKNYVKKKATGDCRYRVRAINGSSRSKWSAAKRIFAANAYITNLGHDGSHVNFRVLVSNKTSSPMGFIINAITGGSQHLIYAVDSSGNLVKQLSGNLIPAGGGIAVIVNAKKTQSIYVQSSYISASDYARIKNCSFVLGSSFYPNPEVEPMSTQMALGYTTSVKDSVLAGK